MYWGDEVGAVVGDVGRRTARVGLGGEDAPRRVVAVVGDSRQGDVLEATWRRALGEMWTDVADRPVVAAVDPLADDAERRLLAEVLMDKLGAPACYIARAPALSAFASGRASALVVDVGDAYATVCPVYDGYTMLGACRRSEAAGGADVSRRLAKLLGKHGADAAVVSDVKHTLCRAWRLPPFDAELASELDDVDFSLPDGTKVSFGPQRFEVCEPSLAALAETMRGSLEALDADLRRLMSQDIVVVGGGSLLDGIGERLGREMAGRLPTVFRPRVQTPGTKDERLYSAFVGGSVLASLGTFQQLWLSKKEWDEAGPDRAVAEKFLQ